MLYYLQRRHKLTQHRFNGFDVNEWSHSYNVGLNVGPLDAVWYTQFRVISVTRWLDNFFNIWPFTAVKISPIISQIPKVCSAFCQIRNRLSKICQIFVNFCQSGKISQNLVTLLAMSHFLSLILIFLSFSFISHRNCLLNALLITLSHKTHRQFNSISRLLIATFHFILF